MPERADDDAHLRLTIGFADDQAGHAGHRAHGRTNWPEVARHEQVEHVVVRSALHEVAQFVDVHAASRISSYDNTRLKIQKIERISTA